jgi:hypothetical protein
MTQVSLMVRAERLEDVQFWREQNGSWTVTMLFDDADGKTIAFEVPEDVFAKAKKSHDQFIASGRALHPAPASV